LLKQTRDLRSNGFAQQQQPCTVAECAQQAVEAANRAEAAVHALEQKLDALVNIIQGDSGQCIRIREEQLCWLRSGVLEVPAGPSAVRYFTVKFPASFVAPPTITPTVLTKGTGANFAIANYEVSTSQVTGTVIESLERG
jgi:hypothetical protein